MGLGLDAVEMGSHSGVYTGEVLMQSASPTSSASDTFLSPSGMASKVA